MTELADRREIGGYRFVRLLGKGGMGAVYEAVGADGVHRAVKMFTLDHGNRDFLFRRFAVRSHTACIAQYMHAAHSAERIADT